MKNLVWLSVTLTLLIVLAAVLTDSPAENPGSPAADETPQAGAPCCSSQSGCSNETCATDTAPNQQTKAACCLAAKDAALSDAAKTDAPSCQFCSGDQCPQECKDCADARKNQTAVAKQPMQARGKGMMMRGRHGHDAQHDIDHEDFFFLIEHKDTIRRTVKNLPDGIETLTESDDKDVAARIQKHVESMYDRMENVNPIRMRDPLFREIFANAKKITMDVEHTEQGVLVRETSKDPYVVKLLQEHAKVVSLFIKNGYSELPKNHAPPKPLIPQTDAAKGRDSRDGASQSLPGPR
ncbi:hypothetical protein [Stieleria mannarensis]|uniref:hypothetical protein n=1 Tax=Stieleria mannarensis TaxID=2755585 RepID=UPI0016008CA8|nr:hypothetical protein [Rhodopirellula sp. JC639]